MKISSRSVPEINSCHDIHPRKALRSFLSIQSRHEPLSRFARNYSDFISEFQLHLRHTNSTLRGAFINEARAALITMGFSFIFLRAPRDRPWSSQQNLHKYVTAATRMQFYPSNYVRLREDDGLSQVAIKGTSVASLI